MIKLYIVIMSRVLRDNMFIVAPLTAISLPLSIPTINLVNTHLSIVNTLTHNAGKVTY